MNLTCPCCHARYPLEAALEDGAARELMGLLASRPMELSRPLVAYLGLWRSKSRALAWDRALRLAWEVIELEQDAGRLGAALAQTVDSIHAKREREPARPLTSHNYLKRVLESLTGRPAEQRQEAPAPPAEDPPDGPVHPDVAGRLGPLVNKAVRGT